MSDEVIEHSPANLNRVGSAYLCGQNSKARSRASGLAEGSERSAAASTLFAAAVRRSAITTASTGLFDGDTAGNTDTVAYSVKYDSSSLSFTNGADNSARSASDKVSGQVSPVTISYTGDPTVAADTYADTLNFTMTVN